MTHTEFQCFFLLFIISFVYISFFPFIISFISCLHSKDTKFGVSGLDLVTATHGGSQSEAKVVASVLGRDDAVVLLWFLG